MPDRRGGTGNGPLFFVGWKTFNPASQKAAVAVEMLPMLEAEAKERMKAGGGMHTGNQHTGIKMEGVSTLRQAADSSRQPTSVRIAASAIGVSNGNISEMKRITNVAPERAEEIKQGKTTVTAVTKELKQARPPLPKPKLCDRTAAGLPDRRGGFFVGYLC